MAIGVSVLMFMIMVVLFRRFAFARASGYKFILEGLSILRIGEAHRNPPHSTSAGRDLGAKCVFYIMCL